MNAPKLTKREFVTHLLSQVDILFEDKYRHAFGEGLRMIVAVDDECRLASDDYSYDGIPLRPANEDMAWVYEQ